MAKRNRRTRERAGGRTLRRFAAAALIFLIPPGLGADSLNLTTWYPAPYGVYSQLRSTGNSYFAYQGGNVGIGTTNPQFPLDILRAGTFSAGSGLLRTEAFQINGWGDLYLRRIDSGDTTWKRALGTVGSTLYINGGAPDYSAVFIQGNVGIGTTSFRWPKMALDVHGCVHVQIPNATTDTGGTETSYGLAISNDVDSTLAIRSLGGGVMHLATDSPGRELRLGGGQFEQTLTIKSGGNVGIGTTSPAAKLQVGTSGDGSVALANAWNTFSSRRFKDDIRPIGGALGKISRLRGVEFEWKGSGKRDMGVVAEEVGQVFPEIVDYETGGRDARGLDYSKLVAPLIEAVKDQQEEIQALRNLIDIQKEAVNDQRQQSRAQSTRIEALEKTLAEVRKK